MNRLKTVLEALPDATVVLDPHGRVRLANRACLALLGYELSELEGAHVSLLHPPHEEPRGPNPWLAPADGTSVVSRQVALWTKGGLSLSVDLSVRSSEWGGEMLHLVAIHMRAAGGDEGAGATNRVHEATLAAWNVGIFEYDFMTERCYCSPRLLDAFGFPPGTEPTTAELRQRIHPEDHALLDAHRAQALDPNGDGRYDVIYRVQRPDGQLRYLHARMRVEFGYVRGERRPLLFHGSIRDITRKQELSLALKRNEARLELAVELSRVGIFDREILPHEGSTPYWSSTMRTMLGYPADAPADPAWFAERVHASYMARMQAAIERANRGDGRVEVEVCWMHPDGGVRWFLIRSWTLFSEKSDVPTRVRSIGALMDITERRVAEEEIRQRSEIMDATPDFVAITDRVGRLVYLNHAARDFMGIPENRAVFAYDFTSLFSAETLEQLKLQAARIAVRDGAWRGETSFVRHDGVSVPMSQVVLAHRDPAGAVTHFSTIARDLSREKQLEAQFMQAQKMEAVGRLAGGVAHDFNNLLSVIIGSCELAMLDIEKDHPSWKEMEQVNLAAQRAAAVTRQLLAFGRKQILKPAVLSVGQVMSELTAMLERVVDDTIELQIEPCDEEMCIRADRTQIQQILLNMVVNARDAMPGGGRLSIGIERRTLSDALMAESLQLQVGEYAVLRVSDTGVGMSPEVREHIFEPFFTTKGPGQGTGLGLSTVFGIVRQSSGGVLVESEPGVGTTFEVLLPCTDEEPTVITVERPKLRAGRSRKVLVAEDNDQLRTLIAQVLRRAGYDVFAARNGAEALEMSRTVGPWLDLLLTDVLMPGMTGKELAEHVQAERPETQTLFMSGYTEDSIVHHGVLDPDVNFISKPVSPGRLLDAIAGVLRDQDERDQAQGDASRA